jgi:uncharacterized protein (TIGR00106 family)
VHVIVDLCVIPIGVGTSVGAYVAECQRVLTEARLTHAMHAYGTTIEGEWDAVMAAVKQCHARVHEMGAPRVHSTLRVGTRTDKAQSAQDKIDSVNHRLSSE